MTFTARLKQYQFLISLTIFLEGLCSILEELEERNGRSRLFESGGKWRFREVCNRPL
jgi:hypothetical protein